VFTNTPSKAARPVPGFKTERRTTGAALPTTDYDPFIQQVASEFDLEPALIKAVALVESGFNPRAVSPKGAKGLMQLMPATARSYGVKNVHDPYENLRAGANHLRTLLDEFSGDLTLALAAYNAGSGAVRRHGGVPRYRETQDYVRKVEGHLGAPKRRARAPAPASSVGLRLNPDGSVTLSN
jgi:soluble lytic murein transglycosylase-like protein